MKIATLDNKNHDEHNGKYSNITNDIDDAEKLNTILSNKYPQLKYKIIVIWFVGNVLIQLIHIKQIQVKLKYII